MFKVHGFSQSCFYLYQITYGLCLDLKYILSSVGLHCNDSSFQTYSKGGCLVFHIIFSKLNLSIPSDIFKLISDSCHDLIHLHLVRSSEFWLLYLHDVLYSWKWMEMLPDRGPFIHTNGLKSSSYVTRRRRIIVYPIIQVCYSKVMNRYYALFSN